MIQSIQEELSVQLLGWWQEIQNSFSTNAQIVGKMVQILNDGILGVLQTFLIANQVRVHLGLLFLRKTMPCFYLK